MYRTGGATHSPVFSSLSKKRNTRPAILSQPSTWPVRPSPKATQSPRRNSMPSASPISHPPPALRCALPHLRLGELHDPLAPTRLQLGHAASLPVVLRQDARAPADQPPHLALVGCADHVIVHNHPLSFIVRSSSRARNPDRPIQERG